MRAGQNVIILSLMDADSPAHRFHGLIVYPKGLYGKKHPVHCPHCKKMLEGRNRSKIWQHVSSQDHRKLFNESQQNLEKKPIKDKVRSVQETILHDSCQSVVEGECNGLRLNSTLGVKTRLGSVHGLCNKTCFCFFVDAFFCNF